MAEKPTSTWAQSRLAYERRGRAGTLAHVERRGLNMEIRRGDIFYVMRSGVEVGSEQWSGRPGVVVSCDENNIHSEVIEVAYCTTQPKSPLPTHVGIMSTNRPSTVLCEQINAVSVERIGDYIGRCTADEMREIDIAIATSLGLKKYPGLIQRLKERDEQEKGCQEKAREDMPHDGIAKGATLETERDIYRKLYEDLLDRVLRFTCPERAG